MKQENFLHELTAEQLVERAVRCIFAQYESNRSRIFEISWTFGLPKDSDADARALCRKFNLDPDEEVSR